MNQIPFTLTPDDAKQPAIGLIVLQSDETMEHELRCWLPGNYRLFHSRIPNQVEINHDSLESMQTVLPQTTHLLPQTTQFNVIVYGCTSASTVIGEERVATMINEIFPTAKVTNPLSAIKAQLRSLGASNIALLTPYVPDVSLALIKELERSGFQVLRSGSFFESRDDRVARISEASLIDAIQSLASHNPIDAIVASCTNLRTYSFIQSLQSDLGIPVLSSNSCLAWHIEALVTGD